MLFLNKNTGLKWEINNEEHQNRLKNDSDYEVVEAIPEEHITLDLDTLEYKELQAIAKEKGLKHTGIRKDDLLKSLKEGE
ncbi:hypothetical protein KTC92_02520 [Clostridium sp. CM027]|uniref:hypothetical protein n=1 Tax=Clostridium sp. CM027 TaxID=2849865 RepID=UPI001C6F300F|nr:hypothetical protein [Clostridium sp. CM027]MBW9147299.1 hypothetical protein [Clostridium sp. CM027]UVE41391.1 hypothetical protein KTC92_02520 [Clostridium sp. CM027]